MSLNHRFVALSLASLSCVALLAACGGGGGGSSSSNAETPSSGASIPGSSASSPTTSPTTYRLGGTIQGLTSSGLSLSDGTDTLSIQPTQAQFSFPSLLSVGTVFSVTITSQPTGQTCTVSPASSGISSASPSALTVSCSHALLPGAENLPSLSAPQPGSLAQATAGIAGIYTSLLSTLIVDTANNFIYVPNVGMYAGSMSLTGSNWSLNSDSKNYFMTVKPASGSGTFINHQTLTGSIQTTPIDLTYNAANALAINQTDLEGTWVSSNSGVTISLGLDASGNISGTSTGGSFGICTLTGTYTQTNPGSQFNLFNVVLTASGSGCSLEKGNAYTGLSAVMFTAAGDYVANGYRRYLSLGLKTDSGSTLSAYPVKQ